MHEQAAMQRSMVNESANGRFKRSFSSWFWGSMITATVAHFGFFAFLGLATAFLPYLQRGV